MSRKKDKNGRVFSGASPQQVAADLETLVDFQEAGLSLEALRDLIDSRLTPHLMRYDLPAFQSMFNSFPEKGARFGAGVALAYNQGVTNWQVSPGGATLEELCCKALCRLFGFGPDSDATFMYCGTYANQQAVYLAIHKLAEEKGFDFAKDGLKGFESPQRLKILTSADAHFSVRHAVRMLGLGEDCLIPLSVDKNRRMQPREVHQVIESLPGESEPFCVITTAGTTSTGSVDPVRPISAICEDKGIWLHVDGAYGLAYSLVPEWKHLFDGVELADSVSWDPHKQMGVPIPNSILFVRRREDFGRMALFSDYFNIEASAAPNPGLKSPPSTRPFAALSLVATIRHQGLTRIIERLRSPLLAVKTAYEQLLGNPDIQLMHKPDTGIICFRIVPQGIDPEQLNLLQRHIYDTIISEGTRSISITSLDGMTVLRLLAVSLCITNQDLLDTVSVARRTAREHLRNG